jgi:hypothetical protein
MNFFIKSGIIRRYAGIAKRIFLVAEFSLQISLRKFPLTSISNSLLRMRIPRCGCGFLGADADLIRNEPQRCFKNLDRRGIFRVNVGPLRT